MNIESLKRTLEGTDWSLRQIFNSILIEDASQQGKSRIGAKFPVHFSRMGRLIDWYPNAKIIHITRDPRAIYNSQLFKYYSKYTNSRRRYIFRLMTLLYVIFIYKWDHIIHKRYNDYSNYLLSKYEDIVFDFENNMKRICSHVDIDFHSKMEDLPLKGSSFSENKKSTGLYSDSTSRYKKTLT